MQLKENAVYALVVPTSMGVRITPVNFQPVHCSNMYYMQATSAETNVASVISYLGLRVKVLTAFVKDSPIARFIKDDLASRHIEYEGKEVPQGGPWGYRHQFNIADMGFGVRGPRVWNDRAGEVGRTLSAKDFDLEKLFGHDGVKILHMSGLIAALSPETGEFCLELARTAKKYGTKISFDLNYRASFWKNREKELRDIFTEIVRVADILIGNEEDYQLCLGVEGPEAGGKDILGQMDNFKEMIARVKSVYPNISVFATTLREVLSANKHLWGAIMLEGDNWHVAEPREIHVLDRIGGGDAFVGGLLYGILKGWEPDKWVKFGWATGAMATTFLTDYAQPADEEQVWSIWEGNARVKR
ncbi:2-keto-3-deoxygluconate kinase KdgK [Thermoclostridium stercorarium subsp. stercorarium DSM 8532]|jgi:2-dehydro-3-deoxygluconokinase|uniref:2-keto-3-deoxygluconate kinase KdgK n=3 Tax=Thermoclostridium stercorarium TaxID=1510 RepID=L7VS55_THES1|nr:sugar kinase [Thermoclostridium stercorarium]AGC69484.1 2-keto-3-deoxygluconate kinase KdgK [Thermoclostridium stercorarium subsp. stercorarium DSM 8532]AGI40437.1 Gck [Thermoclostridium stercorarium subsp. stercorarium DSM 8532]ANW99725.1 2-keto-3-deoxygluconate kinase [Thermoclostridium stercorarium subsp. thermolacticum DSM 2910]ANX02351.1 2-keto-3-deoxygluconate kinase [Thermoclostridium stercorarium subsp. leptospartum DSM 9219]UZQ85429.1 sugar kinase [Thermoclostridium stercorarium]